MNSKFNSKRYLHDLSVMDSSVFQSQFIEDYTPLCPFHRVYDSTTVYVLCVIPSVHIRIGNTQPTKALNKYSL